MPYNPETQKSVLIARSSHALLLQLMAMQDRGQQQTLDFLIKQAARKAGLLVKQL